MHGDNRAEALKKMATALDEVEIEGVKTNIPLHRKILQDHDFIAGKVDINFLTRFA